MTGEVDPNGLSASTPGAKLDAGKVRMELIFDLMPRALLAIGEVGTFGAAKYSDGGWQHVENGESRYRSAGDRHRLKRMIEGEHDLDSGLLHLAHQCWNGIAELELMLRRKEAEKESE